LPQPAQNSRRDVMKISFSVTMSPQQVKGRPPKSQSKKRDNADRGTSCHP
jgi:hypothetical protein